MQFFFSFKFSDFDSLHRNWTYRKAPNKVAEKYYEERKKLGNFISKLTFAFDWWFFPFFSAQ